MAKIYKRIETGDIDGAQRDFGAQRAFLKQNLDPDAFEGLKLTLENLGPAPAVAPASVPAPAQGPD